MTEKAIRNLIDHAAKQLSESLTAAIRDALKWDAENRTTEAVQREMLRRLEAKEARNAEAKTNIR